jgi:DNA-binding MarR family transcriptional regulator
LNLNYLGSNGDGYDDGVAERDSIDDRLAIWGRELPNLDLVTEGVVDRIRKLAKHLSRTLDETAAAYGLSSADWSVLAMLRARGEPYRVPAGELAELTWVSPGALTPRLDRLEERGLIRRVPDREDRRVLQIELTPEGDRTWTEAVGVQAAKERFVDDALSPAEKERLNALLRKLVRRVEGA